MTSVVIRVSNNTTFEQSRTQWKILMLASISGIILYWLYIKLCVRDLGNVYINQKGLRLLYQSDNTCKILSTIVLTVTQLRLRKERAIEEERKDKKKEKKERKNLHSFLLPIISRAPLRLASLVNWETTGDESTQRPDARKRRKSSLSNSLRFQFYLWTILVATNKRIILIINKVK